MNNFETLPLDPAQRLRALKRALRQPAKRATFTVCPTKIARGVDKKTRYLILTNRSLGR